MQLCAHLCSWLTEWCSCKMTSISCMNHVYSYATRLLQYGIKAYVRNANRKRRLSRGWEYLCMILEHVETFFHYWAASWTFPVLKNIQLKRYPFFTRLHCQQLRLKVLFPVWWVCTALKTKRFSAFWLYSLASRSRESFTDFCRLSKFE